MRMPPWPPQLGDVNETCTCTRCGGEIPPHWRHYWPPCRRCNLASLAGVQLMAAFGIYARDFLYDIARPDCPDCDGTGYTPCQPQDMSVLRMSGVCNVCGEAAFRLVSTVAADPDIEGSERHYQREDERDHVAVVKPGALKSVVGDYLERAER